MSIFFITFAVFILVIAGMAIGVIFHRKSITGSCGGLSAMGIEKECDCPEPCDARKRREAKAAKLNEWQKQRIL